MVQSIHFGNSCTVSKFNTASRDLSLCYTVCNVLLPVPDLSSEKKQKTKRRLLFLFLFSFFFLILSFFFVPLQCDGMNLSKN